MASDHCDGTSFEAQHSLQNSSNHRKFGPGSLAIAFKHSTEMSPGLVAFPDFIFMIALLSSASVKGSVLTFKSGRKGVSLSRTKVIGLTFH